MVEWTTGSMAQYKSGLPDQCVKPGEMVTFVYPYHSIKPIEVDSNTFDTCKIPPPDVGIIDNEPFKWTTSGNGPSEKWHYFISTDGHYCSYGLKMKIFITEKCGDDHSWGGKPSKIQNNGMIFRFPNQRLKLSMGR